MEVPISNKGDSNDSKFACTTKKRNSQRGTKGRRNKRKSMATATRNPKVKDMKRMRRLPSSEEENSNPQIKKQQGYTAVR